MNAADSYTDYRTRTETSLDAAYDAALWRVQQAAQDADAYLTEFLVKEDFSYSGKHHLWRMHSEIKALSAALAKIPFLKANYNPNQPRVPSGQPGGGQWTDGDSVAGNSEVKHIASIPDSSGKIPNVINIFIGGFFDSSDHGNVLRSASLNRNIYGYNYYAAHDSKSSIIKMVRRIKRSHRINLIGHSWGGDTAAFAVLALPGKIHTLVTVDPVSWIWPDFKKVRNNTKHWININAVGNTAQAGNGSTGDIIAGIGRSWDNSPKDHATFHFEAPYIHEDFDAMMNYSNTHSMSTRNIINGK